MKEKIFNYGELFCGPGGLALGAVRASFKDGRTIYRIRHRWATDYDFDSCQTYINNICPDDPSSVIFKDVEDLKIESLPKIDVFAYGFPCNDFSIVGEQNGFKGRFGPLYTYGIKVLNKFKPKFFVAENVSGLASVDNGSMFKRTLRDLELAGNGYAITPHLYKAEDYGVPQKRHRIIIVGIDKKLNTNFRVPKPTHLKKYVSVREALENPPIPKLASNNELPKQAKVVVERLKHIKPGQNAWNAILPNRLKLNVEKAKLSQIYRRLNPSEPSYTITGSGGGGTHGYHYAKPRALTNREKARIQTFPDGFVFEGKTGSVRRQIGMAVPPKLSKIIFTAALKTLAKKTYPSVDSNLNLLL